MTDGEMLLTAIRTNPLELTPRLAYHDWAEEHPDTVRAQIAAVMAVPGLEFLTRFGFGVGRRVGESSEDRQERIRLSRLELLANLEEFVVAVAWLATKGKRATVDRRRNS